MLLSYFPIFLFTITILIFLSFIIVNEISHKETIKADRISTGYIVDTVSRTLRGIELDVLEEVQKNKHYSEFLNTKLVSDNGELVFDIVDSMNSMIANDSLIDSIYLYRAEDHKTLTRSGVMDWDSFTDQAFISEALSKPSYQGWSQPRSFLEMRTEKERQVLTMYKRAPLPFGTDGLLVINVNMYAVERMIRSMNNDDVSFLDVRDASGNLLFSTRTPYTDTKEAKGSILNEVSFDMLGWTFESGIVAGQLFVWVSVISYIWIVIGVATVLFAIIYIIYITRKNYKPIRVMMNRIESIQLRKEDGFGMKLDELSLIDHTLENLIQQTSDYEKQQREIMLVSRRQLFMDLVQGKQLETQDLEERLLQLKLLPEGRAFERFAFMLVDIGQYGDFRSGFSVRDQNMLKFALTNVLQELARDEGMYGWAEWISESRLGIIIGINGENEKERIRIFAEHGRTWIADNLRIALLFGVGPAQQGWGGIGISYKAAADALQHKLSLGKEAVIMSEDVPEDARRRWYKHLQLTAELVREFRLSTGEWRTQLERIFERIESDRLKDEDIQMLLQTMMDMLGSELGDISDSLLEHFQGEQGEVWKRALEESTTLEQMKAVVLEHLTEVYRTYVAFCETKNHLAMINEMKAYIEENFADPDLSLKHLSDRFNISGKYASYLFKEEFNMKFVDFLVQLRMSHAEKLLAETEESVQHIALQVGYANSITFGRMFKREIHVTPGEYRKLKLKPGQAR